MTTDSKQVKPVVTTELIHDGSKVVIETTLVHVLITQNAIGHLYDFRPLELSKLEKDFANFKNSGHPAGGSYTHSVSTATAKSSSLGSFWRWVVRSKPKEAALDLIFEEMSIITGE